MSTTVTYEKTCTLHCVHVIPIIKRNDQFPIETCGVSVKEIVRFCQEPLDYKTTPQINVLMEEEQVFFVLSSYNYETYDDALQTVRVLQNSLRGTGRQFLTWIQTTLCPSPTNCNHD